MAKESLSGTCSVPAVSARPDQPTVADLRTRSASSEAESDPTGAWAAPVNLGTSSGVTTSATAVSSTTSQRAHMRQL